MTELSALITDEGKWPVAAISLALLVAGITLVRNRGAQLSVRRRILAAMNLYLGVMIATMALGHFLAVTIKLATDTLRGSPLLLYTIAILLAIPSLLLIRHARALFASNQDLGQQTVTLNAWLAITLLMLGLPNIPLALPAVLNIAYQQHSRRAVGWAIVSVAGVLIMGLLVGSLVFLASGQSFEQFSGMK